MGTRPERRHYGAAQGGACATATSAGDQETAGSQVTFKELVRLNCPRIGAQEERSAHVGGLKLRC